MVLMKSIHIDCEISYSSSIPVIFGADSDEYEARMREFKGSR